MDNKIEEQTKLISQKNKEINKAKCRLQRKEKKLASLKKEIDNKNLELCQLQKFSSNFKPVFVVSSKKAKLRKKEPSTPNTQHTSKVIRRKETMTASSAIHGNEHTLWIA